MELKYIILETLLNEGRLEDTIKKYSGRVSEDIIKELSKADPSGNNKYLDWMSRTFIEAPHDKTEIIAKVKCFHENVNRLSDNHVKAIYGEEKWVNPSEDHKLVLESIRKTPKDINAYPSHLWFIPMCEYFEEQKPKTTSRVKLYEDNKWLVVSPLTHKASCDYGIHSNWCVSTSDRSYFDKYTSKGILVFFIDKQGKNPKKPNSNDYKVAVNIPFNKPDVIDWEWYSMEDDSVDSLLMLNFVPKNLISIVENYVKELLNELQSENKIDEDELTSNSSLWFRKGNAYYIVPKITNWSDVNSSVEYLKKYDDETEHTDINYLKEIGMPYFVINFSETGHPELEGLSIRFNSILDNDKIIDNKFILKSTLINSITDRWSSFDMLKGVEQEYQNKFIEVFSNLFNESNVDIKQRTKASDLKVGDYIYMPPSHNRWTNPVRVRIDRATEKSLSLSNGKRILKNDTRRFKAIGPIKIVDEIRESKWIKTRII